MHEPPAHDPHDPHNPGYNPGIDSPGYEVTDVNVNGIVVDCVGWAWECVA
jgi:hypothetical protein